MIGDSFDVVAGLEAGSFTRVIHDPPAFSLAGDLYSGEFYRQLYRVMRNRSQLFHYIGDPESKSGQQRYCGGDTQAGAGGFQAGEAGTPGIWSGGSEVIGEEKIPASMPDVMLTRLVKRASMPRLQDSSGEHVIPGC